MSDKEKTATKPSTAADPNSHSSSDSSDEGQDPATMEMISRFFAQTLNLGGNSKQERTKVERVIPDLSFDGFADHWREHGFKKIVTMVGAGISTSAGIPDFRSPGCGLYHNLKKYKLPHPMSIFDLEYFETNPAPFFTLAKELYPGSFVPTPTHYFVRLLHDKGLLQRHYTQNIDTLDRLAGLPKEKVIEAHGSFYTNHCIRCRKEYDMVWMKEQIFADKLPTCEGCKGIVKPDIVFFGENLPVDFYTKPEEDFKDCDLLIIMGTSLEVQPFASLTGRPGPRCLRLLINRDAVGRSSFLPSDGTLLYEKPNNIRDVAYLGDCDAGVLELAKKLGWDEELQQLMSSERQNLIEQEEQEKISSEKKRTEQKQEKQEKHSQKKNKKCKSLPKDAEEAPSTSG